MKDFKDSHKRRCKGKITEYLELLARTEPETCEAVKREMEPQLRELGIEGCVKDCRRLGVR